MILLKPTRRLLCVYCGHSFHPAPNVRNPKTCGHPDCVKVYKRETRNRSTLNAFPNDLYHSVLNELLEKGMLLEWFLIYALGETGLLVSEFLHLRPADLYFDGPDKKVLVNGDVHYLPRVYQPISGAVAGVIERHVKRNDIERWDYIFPYTKRSAQKMFERALRISSIQERYGTRSLRHMYGLNVARATDSGETVAHQLRLKDVHSASVYLHVSRENL